MRAFCASSGDPQWVSKATRRPKPRDAGRHARIGIKHHQEITGQEEHFASKNLPNPGIVYVHKNNQMNIRTKAMLVSLIAVLAPPLSRAQLVDGGFELPHVATGTSASYFAGDDMGGWTVLGSSGVSLINSEYSEPQNGITGFNAYEGTQALDITGINDDNHPTELSSGVTQTVSTVAGAAYTLQFYVGRASGSSSIYGTPAVVRLEINGGTPISFTNSNSVPGAVDWQQFVYNFTASGSSTSITFLNGTTSNNYDGVDDVTLVPEPSTWMLLGVSAGLLILTVHRRAACV